VARAAGAVQVLCHETICAFTPPSQREAVTAAVYARQRACLPGGAYHEEGLFPWERAALTSFPFPPRGQTLVGAAGGRREMAGLSELGLVPQGISADLIATLEGFSREEVDAFVLESQRRAAVAVAEGRFARSLVPVVDPDSGAPLLAVDEYPRPGTTREALAALEPSFAALGASPVGPRGETLDQLALARYPQASAIRHVHTAGNSSGIVDGAAAVLLGTALDELERRGLSTALVTLCIGGGQGIATILERV
jgi:acetyl-CoA acetyltransferase